MKILVLVLILASVCFGADLYVAGVGAVDAQVQTWTGGTLIVDTFHTVRLACTIKSVSFNMTTAAGDIDGTADDHADDFWPGDSKAMILLLSSANVVKYKQEVDAEVISAGAGTSQIITKAVSWAAVAGDRIGVYTKAVSANSKIGYASSYGVENTAVTKVYTNGTDLPAVGVAVDSPIDRTNVSMLFIASTDTVTGSSYLPYENDTGWDDASATIPVPFFEDVGQYFIFEDVNCPEGESVVLGLYTANSLVKAVTIDGTAHTISDGTNTKDLHATEDITQKFNVLVWVSPDGTDSEIQINYVNYAFGQGGQGVADTAHFALSRTPLDDVSNLTASPITRVKLTLTTGSVGKISLARKPVLAVGDSFVCSSTQSGGKWVLAHVGAELAEAFDEERYVINGGISGNKLLNDSSSAHTACLKRWDSATGDMCSYRDVLVVFVNGPGLNDIASIVNTKAEQKEYIAGLSGGLALMVRQALSSADMYGGTNEVVMCEMIPYTSGTYANIYNAAVIREYNKMMQKISFLCDVPLARMNKYSLGYVEADPMDYTHPPADGDAWIAGKIADSYELNQVSGNSNDWLRNVYKGK